MRDVIGCLLCLCVAQLCSGFMQQMMGGNGMSAGRMGMLANSNTATTNVTGRPPICEANPCLGYTVVQKTPTFEHRRYERTVVAVAESSPDSMSSMVTFYKLSNYFKSGKNAEGIKMKLTYPIIIPVNASTSHLAMMALPTENTASPPDPLSRTVKIFAIPAMDVIVKAYQSSMFASNHDEAVQQFRLSLGPNAPISASGGAFIAEYNSPYNFFGRLGEIWLVADYPYNPNGNAVPAVDVSH